MTVQKPDKLTESLHAAFDQRRLTENGHAMAAGFESWMQAATECQREIAEFVQSRLAKDSATMRDMLASRSPGDAMQIHARWMQEVLRDYGSEMTRILAIYTRHASEAGQRRR